MEQQPQIAKAQRQPFSSITLIAAGLLSFGLTLLFMSSAYVRDLELLRQVPESIWLFVCGVPTQNDMTLPFMISISVLTILVSVGMIGIQQVRHRLSRQHASS
jgi:hypothetical protein